jgi:hypothetical protein
LIDIKTWSVVIVIVTCVNVFVIVVPLSHLIDDKMILYVYVQQAPHYTHPADKALFQAEQPIPVSCCWNGAVVVKSEVFTQRSSSSEEAKNRHPVLFRRPPSNESGSCDESECTTFCRDLYNRGFQNIYVNPRVHISYAYDNSRKASKTQAEANEYPLTIPSWAQLSIAINKAERFPLTMACCSLWRGANFAPKLGLFVGCHQVDQAISAKEFIYEETFKLRARLAHYVQQDPRPSFMQLQNSLHNKKKGGKLRASTVMVEPTSNIVLYASDLASEATLTFNRREVCKSEYGGLKQKGTMMQYGGVVDAVAEGGGGGSSTPIQRLITIEDTWMVPPPSKVRPFFTNNGLCARERETYRMSAGVAYRASYGPDMLLVSDRCVCVCLFVLFVTHMVSFLVLFFKVNYTFFKSHA